MMVLLLFFDVHRHVEQVFLGRPTQRQDGGGGLQTLAEAFKRIFAQSQKPLKLQTDKVTEFRN